MKSDSPYNGSGSLTREQFLFYEMRTTAKLLIEGMTYEEVIKKIMSENLFQYPTEKSVRSMTNTCLSRLHSMNDPSLVQAIATQPAETSKQIRI